MAPNGAGAYHEVQADRLQLGHVALNVPALDVVVPTESKADNMLVPIKQRMPPFAVLSAAQVLVWSVTDNNGLALLELKLMKLIFEPRY